MKELNIGEMAKLNCLSTKSLRIYHDMGLLPPKRVDPQTGYRFYEATQCFIIDQIQQLQAMGASLSEIKEASACKDSKTLVDLVRQRRDAIDEEIARLRLARHSANEFIHNYETYACPPPTNVVLFERLPVRYALQFPVEHDDAAPVSNESGPNLEAWEIALHLAKRRMVDQGIPTELFHNVGWRMHKDNFCNKNFQLDSIVVMVRTQGLAQEYGATELPAGDWATLYTCSYLGDDGANSEYGSLQYLAASIDKLGFEACGDCINEVVFNAPTLHNGWRDALFKLQVPVCTKTHV